MVDIIYLEESIRNSVVSERVIARYPDAQLVNIGHYGEVFNPRTQNFRLQKNNPAIILAGKDGRRIMDAPDEYTTGGDGHFYFSHMLNCIYDCRYCFLQGMYRSANYLLFVNYDDFASDLRQHAADCGAKKPWYFSGYDCDSLALEPVTGFADAFLPVFAEQHMQHATLELRTKSTQIRSLLKRDAMDNVVVAFSLNPQSVIESVEQGTPALDKRLQAMRRLQDAGWRVGLRFDPVVWHADFENSYQTLFQQVFTELDVGNIDSITLGAVRLPKNFHKTMARLFPEHWLFKAGMAQREGAMIGYKKSLEEQLLLFCQQQIDRYVDLPVFVYSADNVTSEQL